MGILPSLPPAYRPPSGGRTLSGFPRSPRPRHGRVGCPLYAGDGGALPAGLTSPAGTRRLCQRPVPEPRYHSHLAGLAMTTHHRGFTFFTLSAFSLPVPPGVEGRPGAFPLLLQSPPLPTTQGREETDAEH